MNRIFVILLLSTSYVIAAPTAMLSIVDPNDVRARISKLRQIKEEQFLSDSEQEALNSLWAKAAAIEQMNDRCGSIELTEELDEDCGYFYQYDLPKFETEFFKVTGEIRLSENRLSTAMEQRRNAIHQCFEALQIEAFHPSRYLTLEGTYAAEPLTHGFEVSYDFYIQHNEETIKQLNERMSQWNKVCGKIVLHSDNSGSLAPIFVELLNKSRKNASNVNGTLYFEPEESYHYIDVKTAQGIYGTYYLNGKKIFNLTYSPNKTVFRLRFSKNGFTIYPPDEERRKGKATFNNDSKANGLVGRFSWTSRNSHKHSTNSANKNQSNADSFEFSLQGLGGFYLHSGLVNNKAQEKFNAGENDSLSIFSGMLGLQFVLEFHREIAIGLGGGMSWNSIDLNRCKTYNCDEENIVQNKPSPMLQAEINFGDEYNVGARLTYVMASDAQALYLGGFLELINFVGFELGWVHANRIWDNVYFGLTIRIPPRHISERIESLTND